LKENRIIRPNVSLSAKFYRGERESRKPLSTSLTARHTPQKKKEYHHKRLVHFYT